MKKSIILLAILLSAGCLKVEQKNQASPIKVIKDNTDYTVDLNDVVEIEYDSCEYVRFDGGSGSWGGHKGNCKFCIERNKKCTQSENGFY